MSPWGKSRELKTNAGGTLPLRIRCRKKSQQGAWGGVIRAVDGKAGSGGVSFRKQWSRMPNNQRKGRCLRLGKWSLELMRRHSWPFREFSRKMKVPQSEEPVWVNGIKGRAGKRHTEGRICGGLEGFCHICPFWWMGCCEMGELAGLLRWCGLNKKEHRFWEVWGQGREPVWT